MREAIVDAVPEIKVVRALAKNRRLVEEEVRRNL